MAEIIDKNLKVVLGQLIRVKNLCQEQNQNDVYVSLQIQDENGENERCILFTEIECADMQKIYSSILQKMVYGRLYKFLIGKRYTNVVKVKNYNNQDKYFRISNTQLKKAEKRAQKNKQDLTRKSFFTDLID